jgi:hypothetical protein
MTDKHQVRLGGVQQTLFIPLAARAAETLTLFRASSPATGGRAATARDTGPA